MLSQSDGADTNFLFKYYNRAWSDPLSVVYGKAVLGMAKNGFYIRAHISLRRSWTFLHVYVLPFDMPMLHRCCLQNRDNDAQHGILCPFCHARNFSSNIFAPGLPFLIDPFPFFSLGFPSVATAFVAGSEAAASLIRSLPL